MAATIGSTTKVPFFLDATDLAAGTTFEIASPVDGFVTGLVTIVQTAIVTGGAVTVKVGTTDVAGLSITVADAAAKGTVQSDTATKGSATRAVAKNGRIQVVPAAAFNGGGALRGYVEIASNLVGEELPV